jgi:hypothetical protein
MAIQRDGKRGIDICVRAQGSRIAGILYVVGRALAAVLGALVLVASASASAPPSLRLQSLNPFVVHGKAFRARERVRITLVAPSVTLRRTKHASSKGTFTVDFGTVPLGHCGGYTVRAIGATGSVATLKRTPLPACMP